MLLSFSTLGCPDWDLETILRQGRAFGFDGVDFRGLGEDLDITVLPAFTTGLAATRAQLCDAGLQVSCLSSSLSICEPGKLGANLEEARRTIPVALELGCVRVRVFGNGDLEHHTRPELADFGRDCMEGVLRLDGAPSLQWVFETHDQWTRGVDCRLLLERIPDPAFGVLWDLGHTTRVGGESPERTHQAVAGRIYYTHLKDARYDPRHPHATPDGWRYVPPGQGELPLREALALLQEVGYNGWIMFEHEKRWHPDLEEPEEILPVFLAWVRPLVGR
ncbi:MAG: sugar phosphate isomerase/epimerase [Candidatus Latescibacterota bacterium]